MLVYIYIKSKSIFHLIFRHMNLYFNPDVCIVSFAEFSYTGACQKKDERDSSKAESK